MENMVSIIDNAIPFIVVIMLSLFMTLEVWMPYLQISEYRKTQRWHNLGNVVLTFALNAVLSGIVAYCLTEGTRRQFGLLFHLHLPVSVAIAAGVFLSDLNAYVAHRLYHVVPLFWRFHTVHHSDIEVDASTGLRIHPFEFLFQTATQAIVLPLLGVSISSFVIYVVFLLPLAIINHANVRFPGWYEKYVGLLFVTPNFHRVHHSSYRPETDSNYSEVFSIWDRIFKTRTTRSPEEIHYGLERFREKEHQTFWGMLVTPFKGEK